MLEILPIKVLNETDAPVFGSTGVLLAKLAQQGFPVIKGIVVAPPHLHLKTILENHDFGKKEVFEQSLTLVKKEIESIPIPEILYVETKGQKKFFLSGEEISTVDNLWKKLISIWLSEIKQKIWRQGFAEGLAEMLEPQTIGFIKEVKAQGSAHFNPHLDDVEIEIEKGKLEPKDLKKLENLVLDANKKLFIPHIFDWIYDNQLLITHIKPYTPKVDSQKPLIKNENCEYPVLSSKNTTVKVFYDLTQSITENTVIPETIAGAYVNSEKYINEFKIRESVEELILRLIQVGSISTEKPVLFKLPDLIEKTSGLRGTLRLIHQHNLFHAVCEAFLFTRNKYVKILPDGSKQYGFKNIHLVIPFVRSTNEFMHIKRDLAVNKIMRKNSLELWLELAVPENIINLKEYLAVGLDGVVINLDEMLSCLGGFDLHSEDLSVYQKQVDTLINFLEDGLKLLHHAKVKFLVTGEVTLNPDVLEFLIAKGVYGVVAKQYEVHSIAELLHLTEKRVICKSAGLI